MKYIALVYKIVIDKIKSEGVVLDPIVRFEISGEQPKDINKEKLKIYNPTTLYYNYKTNIKSKVVKWLAYLMDLVEHFLNFL